MRGHESPHRPAVRRSPTGRTPQWVLDEAVGRQPQTDTWRAWSPPAPPSRRRPRRRAALIVTAVALMLGGLMLARPDFRPWTMAGPELAFPHPTPGHEERDQPLGEPLAAAPGGGAYAFNAHQSDATGPVAYDPCRPIHYVMRPDNAPVGGEAILHDAFDRVSAVTGLHFFYDGVTDERPSKKREPFQPDRYGDRWAPVLVAWQTQDENLDFVTDVVGEAGSVQVALDEAAVYVTGAVSLDSAAFDQLLTTPRGAAAARAIVLHELGHLVGLDHVSDPAELMYPTTSATFDFGSGDLTGLGALGRGECFPDL
jgi:hypothetical protein